jgi:hypothetical protein
MATPISQAIDTLNTALDAKLASSLALMRSNSDKLISEF